jgi:hypothetical protein
MPSNLSGIISVDQLRDEIGDPTTNTQFAGHITDSMLQGIIDNHVDWLEKQAYQRLQEGKAKPVKRTEDVAITLSQNAPFPELATGTLGSNHFPYATEAIVKSPSTYNGEPLDYDPRLITKAKKIFYDAFMFDIENRDVLVYPKDVEEITVMVPRLEDAIEEIMGDIFSEVNNNIINRARQMQQARTQEFAEPAYAGGGGGLMTEED